MTKFEKAKKVLATTLSVFMFICCLGAGYGLSSLIFKRTGTPPVLAAYLVSTILGLLIFSLAARLMFQIINRTQHGKQHNLDRHRFLDSTVDALNRIARGDFNVSIEPNEHSPMAEVAEGVNKMAKELLNLEAQRQDFISNVSHEIQSPLTSISGFAALLKSGSLTKEQHDHYVEIIEIESRRMSKLSDSLLKLSALESETTPLSLAHFLLDKQLEHTILMFEPQWAAKNIDVSADLEKVSVHADEDLLSQMWINLLHNAVKFTPEHGRIDVSLRKKGEQIECRIADNGSGIPKEDQVHIFERFYKVDKSRDRSLGGNGLGLSLCKKIVGLHGGQIILESAPGQGTVFIVTMPK